MWSVVYAVMKRLLDNLTSNQLIQLEHIHSEQKTYPTLANSITLTSGATAWALGNFIEIVPANTITKPFDIHYLGIGPVSSAGTVYEIQLFAGLVGSEVRIGSVRVYRQAQQSNTTSSPMQTAIQPANTRISAKSAVSSTGAETIAVGLIYHEY